MSITGWLSSLHGPNHQPPGWLCLVLFPFLSRAGISILLLLDFSSTNKIFSLLLSLLLQASSAATPPSYCFLVSSYPSGFWYFFALVIFLQVDPSFEAAICFIIFLSGLLCASDTTVMLIVSLHFSKYFERYVNHVLKSSS